MRVCKECGRNCKSLQSIKVHLRRTHKMHHVDYLVKHFHDNEYPLCLCGCGDQVTYFRGKFKTYLQGHFIRDNKDIVFTDEVKKKRLQTCMEKYGGPAPASSAKVREKIKQTNLKKYGGSTPFSSKLIREKIKKTNLERYGVESPLQNKDIYNKVRQTNLKKYGVDNPLKRKENIDKITKNLRLSFEEICDIAKLKKYDVLFAREDYISIRQFLSFRCIEHDKIFVSSIFNVKTDFNQCPLCKRAGVSKKEKEIVDYIKSIVDVEVAENTKTIISPKELDIYIPDKKLAIEFHGLFWHSDMFCHNNKNLIHDKFVESRNKGIRLLQIYEDEWDNNGDLWKSIIKNSLGQSSKLFARKCEIREGVKEERIFLKENHLQGYTSSLKNFGLYYDNELVCFLSFRRPMNYDADCVEISRFCSKKNFTVLGGFSKLLKYATVNWINLSDYSKIITYSDCRVGVGSVYENCGFSFVKHTGLDYCYTDGVQRYHRLKYRAANGKTEKEVAEISNVYKIYGAGHYLWELSV